MKKLSSTQKITLATLKSFAKRNENNIYYKVRSDFDGITDCVQSVKMNWKKTALTSETYYKNSGITGIYCVGSSRDYFDFYEDEEYIGIRVYNSCGSTILAAKKEPEPEYIDFEYELMQN